MGGGWTKTTISGILSFLVMRRLRSFQKPLSIAEIAEIVVIAVIAEIVVIAVIVEIVVGAVIAIIAVTFRKIHKYIARHKLGVARTKLFSIGILRNVWFGVGAFGLRWMNLRRRL